MYIKSDNNSSDLNNNIKPPCGMKDYSHDEIIMRNDIIDMIYNCFSTYCGILIDTPVLELESTIHQLYGEEFNKSVYKINSSNILEEKTILRYDLTVPF